MALERTVEARLIAQIDDDWVPNTLRVSPDCQRAAHITGTEAGFAVVLDGMRQPEVFDGIGDLIFSPDGERFAYRAQIGEKQFVVFGGEAGDSFDGTGQRSLCFSPDSQHVAYAVQSDNRWSVIVDGQQEGEFEGLAGLTFSPDSRRVAYRVQLHGHEHAVVDGKVGPAYDAVRDLLFSPDGQRLAYRARSGDRWCVVDGDEVETVRDAVVDASLCFSPESQQFAYVARQGRRSYVIAGGAKSAPYGGVELPLTFSPDGQRLAYVAHRARIPQLPFIGGSRFVVVDGREGVKAAAVKDLTFSPDSKRLAFAARLGVTWSVAVDGEPGHGDGAQDGYESLGDLCFGPDSRRLAFGAKVDAHYVVVVDGGKGNEFDGVVLAAAGGRIRFSAPDTLHYLALKGDDLLAIEENIQCLDGTQAE